ncbi:MAG: hypothetical protein NC095_10785 [Muribaculum sp.]|nr:hypothetical protein [Muribaculum sp.]
MTIYKHLINDMDRFSWHRVWNFGKIYQYSFKRQLVVYGILSVVAAIFGLLPFGAVTQMGLYSMFGTATGIAYYLAPLVLSKWGDTRMVMNLTPALPIEKFIFFMIYFLLLLPLVLFAPTTLAQFIYLKMPSIQTEPMLRILHLAFDYDYNAISKFLQGGGIMLTCFYIVLNSHGNRTIKGILAVFGIMIGLGILGAIFGFTMALHDNIEYGNPTMPGADSAYWHQIVAGLRMPILGLNIFFSIYSVIIMWLCYHRLSHPKI